MKTFTIKQKSTFVELVSNTNRSGFFARQMTGAGTHGGDKTRKGRREGKREERNARLGYSE